MNESVGIIGGADGPTAIFVTRPIGQLVLIAFAAFLVVARIRREKRRKAKAAARRRKKLQQERIARQRAAELDRQR